MIEFGMIAILLGVLGYMLYPMFAGSGAREARSRKEFDRNEISMRKRGLMREIKDIELDFNMGKISAEDYETLVKDYRSQAIDAMKDLDKLDGKKVSSKKKRVEVAVPESERGGFCIECGSELFESAKFCAVCGNEVA